jgi:hypothetical protein
VAEGGEAGGCDGGDDCREGDEGGEANDSAGITGSHSNGDNLCNQGGN